MNDKEINKLQANAAKLCSNPDFINSKSFKEIKSKLSLETTGTLEGTPGASPDVASTVALLTEVIVGARGLGDVADWCKEWNTDKSILYIPIITSGSAKSHVASTGTYGSVHPTLAYRYVNLTGSYGSTISWTKEFIQDATFDTMSVLSQNAGRELARFRLENALTNLRGCATGAAGAQNGGAATSGFEFLSGSEGGMTFAQLLNCFARVEAQGFGPATDILLPTALYWKALSLDQMISSLYDSPTAATSGVLPTRFGVTFHKIDNLSGSAANTTGFCFNKNNSIALVTRNDIDIEPFDYPDTNYHGFVASRRDAFVIVNTGSIVRCVSGLG